MSKIHYQIPNQIREQKGMNMIEVIVFISLLGMLMSGMMKVIFDQKIYADHMNIDIDTQYHEE